MTEQTKYKIRNREQMSQIIDFTRLRYGAIIPTNIDAYIDFGNRGAVVLEVKRKGTKPPFGQKLALERLIANLAKSGVKAVGIYAEYSQVMANNDIDAKECTVNNFYYNHAWHKETRGRKVDAFINDFITTQLPDMANIYLN